MTRSVVSRTQIVKTEARYHETSTNQITTAKRWRGPINLPRWIAMKLCQDRSGTTLITIADRIDVSHYSMVSQTIGRLNRISKDDRNILRGLYTISQDLAPKTLLMRRLRMKYKFILMATHCGWSASRVSSFETSWSLDWNYVGYLLTQYRGNDVTLS